MDISNINKYFFFAAGIVSLIQCEKKTTENEVTLNNFDYIFTLHDTTKDEVLNSKIYAIHNGAIIDSGKFEISTEKPFTTASIQFLQGTKKISKNDTIKINIGSSEHYITEIKEAGVERDKGLSPFSNSSKPSIVSFKIDGQPVTEYDNLELK